MPFQTHNPRLSDQWTPERITILLQLDAENKLSRAGIAGELRRLTGCKFSRNAVIGKLARLGVPKKEPRPMSNRVRRDLERPFRPKIFKQIPKPPAEPLQDSLKLSLNDLTETTCHFPTSADGPPFEYCGHPVSCHSYCAAHYRLCYVKPARPNPEQAVLRVINRRLFQKSLLKTSCEAA
jgi:hypothetical protein